MAGSNNFLQFDVNKQNIVTDETYLASGYRINGAVSGIAPSNIHNKLYYQLSTFVSAFGESLAGKGYTVNDSDIASLTSVLSLLLDSTGGSLSGALKEAPKKSLASSSGTLTLTNESNIFIVTGTESLTAITGWTQGLAFIIWNSSRTLAHSSGLVLKNGGSNRTTSAGDCGVYLVESGVTTELVYFPVSGYALTSHASTQTTYGVSNATNYGHAMASSATPIIASGSGSVGTDNSKYAREGHVHPEQINVSGSSGSCTGNSATATKLHTSRSISLSGDVTGSTSFDGSENTSITATVADDSHNHTSATLPNFLVWNTLWTGTATVTGMTLGTLPSTWTELVVKYEWGGPHARSYMFVPNLAIETGVHIRPSDNEIGIKISSDRMITFSSRGDATDGKILGIYYR